MRKRIVILAAKAKDREDREIPILPDLRKVLDARRKGPDGHDLSADAYVFGDDTYLRSRIDTLDKAFGKLQRRKRMKLVKGA